MAEKQPKDKPDDAVPDRQKAGAGGESPTPDSPREAYSSLPKTPYPIISITTHRALIGKQREIFKRLNANPDLGYLFFINPVLAFKEAGVELSGEIAHHVLHTLQHSPDVRRRRDQLEAHLKEVLGDAPQPNNPRWVSVLLFERLKLRPLAIQGHEPTYLSPIDPAAIERLQALRPQRQRTRPTNQDYPAEETEEQEQRQQAGTSSTGVVRIAEWRPTARRLDLDAPLPQLRPAMKAPAQVSLEELYFYRDSHPLVRDLLELGVIQRNALPFHAAGTYRKIKTGERRNAFRTWITSVRFAEKKR
jgi:hypothetical protein